MLFELFVTEAYSSCQEVFDANSHQFEISWEFDDCPCSCSTVSEMITNTETRAVETPELTSTYNFINHLMWMDDRQSKSSLLKT